MQNYSNPADIPSHTWAPAFTLDWTFYFVSDFDELPPYPTSQPPSYSHFTKGRTWYAAEFDALPGAMREQYLNNCIAIFPFGPLHTNTSYSCDFVILNGDQTAYLVLHEDRPAGAPECCLIGRPFHAPSQNFFSHLYINKWSKQIGNDSSDIIVDWGGLTLPGAGLFAYGFQRDLYPGTNYSVPYAFYFMGIPDVDAVWQYQVFSNFDPSYQPDLGDFVIPEACADAVVCPGWE